MKITLESTTYITTIRPANSPGLEYGIECRVWEGETEGGVKIQALIPRIAARKGSDLAQFEAELQEQRPPSPDFQPFPLRMVL